MPKLKLTIPHNLSSNEVKIKLKNQLEDVLRRKLGDDFILIDNSWMGMAADISFMVNGYSLSISLDIHPKEVRLTGKIPMAAMPFQKQIKKDLLEIGALILS